MVLKAGVKKEVDMEMRQKVLPWLEVPWPWLEVAMV